MAKKPTNKPSNAETLISSAFTLAEGKEWRHISMDDIANHAGIPIADTLSIYKDKASLIADVMNRADQAALTESLNFEATDTIKDRLFALMMARFDYLSPYRQGISKIIKSSGQTPFQALTRLSHVMQSMKLMLETAGIQTNTPSSFMKINGLTLIAANTMRIWLSDQSADQGPNMAALDKALNRADKLASTIFCAVHNNS